MSPETSKRISDFLTDNLPDGHGYALFIAPSTFGEDPQRIPMMLLSNVEPRDIIRAVGATLEELERYESDQP